MRPLDYPQHTHELDRTELKTVVFRCSTEYDRIFSARAGLERGGEQILPRWKPGSTILFTILMESFQSRSWADRVERAVTVAVADWNSRNVGVRFKLATKSERPTFTISYKQRDDDEFAFAFPPSSKSRRLRICKRALKENCDEFLADILRHELGHVLGLRHEDADLKEPTQPSLQLTTPNKNSIMVPRFAPGTRVHIQESDAAALKKLYTLDENKPLGGFEVVTVDPTTRDEDAFKHLSDIRHRDADAVGVGMGAAPHEHNASPTTEARSLFWFSFLFWVSLLFFILIPALSLKPTGVYFL